MNNYLFGMMFSYVGVIIFSVVFVIALYRWLRLKSVNLLLVMILIGVLFVVISPGRSMHGMGRWSWFRWIPFFSIFLRIVIPVGAIVLIVDFINNRNSKNNVGSHDVPDSSDVVGSHDVINFDDGSDSDLNDEIDRMNIKDL